MSYRILQGDVVDMLRGLGTESIDAVVTDPPYGIRFMGKAWDGEDIERQQKDRAKYKQKSYGFQRSGPRTTAAESAGTYDLKPSAMLAFQEWTQAWATEALRVLKPGGHLLSFASTRTYHRMTSGIEDAGFEVRDQIGWVFGSGFPKSHNLDGDWEGWGTALKPAWEPVCVARKPLSGTVAENVQRFRTGALHIDACRVEGEAVPINRTEEWSGFGQVRRPEYAQDMNTLGRWPANLVHDGSEEVLAAFPEAPGQCGEVKFDPDDRKTQRVYGAMRRGHEPSAERVYGESGATSFTLKPGMRRLDGGSAARFFYCAKASREDRNEGCDGIVEKQFSHDGRQAHIENAYQRNSSNSSNSSNSHPTVKPTDLMRWLCRLVTPPGGVVLDCFMGSGSTGKAALLEGFDFIGIEREAEYCEIARARMQHVLQTDAPLFRQAEVQHG